MIATVDQVSGAPGLTSSWDDVLFEFDLSKAIPEGSVAPFVSIDFIGLYRDPSDFNDSIPISQTVLIYPAPSVELSSDVEDPEADNVVSVCEYDNIITFNGKPAIPQNQTAITGTFGLTDADGNSRNSYLTELGDGTATLNSQPLADDIGPGTYTLTYTYQNNISTCAGVALMTIVINPKPVADFSISGRLNYDGCVDENLLFTNLSSVDAPANLNNAAYEWDFDDPDNSTGSNPNSSDSTNATHFFSESGTYFVSMSVTTETTINNKGCVSDVVVNQLSIGDNPQTSFQFTNLITDQATLFTNTTPSNPDALTTRLEWIMDDIPADTITTESEFSSEFPYVFNTSGVHKAVLRLWLPRRRPRQRVAATRS